MVHTIHSNHDKHTNYKSTDYVNVRRMQRYHIWHLGNDRERSKPNQYNCAYSAYTEIPTQDNTHK